MVRPPGRKKALQAVETEAYRRIMSGTAPATLSELAAQLSDWLRSTHPDAPALTLAKIESQISDTWRRRHELIQGGD